MALTLVVWAFRLLPRLPNEPHEQNLYLLPPLQTGVRLATTGKVKLFGRPVIHLHYDVLPLTPVRLKNFSGWVFNSAVFDLHLPTLPYAA